MTVIIEITDGRPMNKSFLDNSIQIDNELDISEIDQNDEYN